MLENDWLKPYFLQIYLENMILVAKNIRMVSLVGLISEFRTGLRFMPARPCSDERSEFSGSTCYQSFIIYL